MTALTPIQGAIIKVVGVGGGGCNAIGRMGALESRHVEFIAINTDDQALARATAGARVHIGGAAARGLGAGGQPEVGERAAEESAEDVRDALRGADLVFIAACMGGGTGTGAAPVVARVATELGALTIGVVTMPFAFEGRRRGRLAAAGVEALARRVDTLLVVSNDRLLTRAGRKLGLADAFALADDALRPAIEGIATIIAVPGLVNVDFADVRSVMRGAGTALMGTGRASGDGRGAEAARRAVTSPLIDTSIDGATAALFTISGHDYTLGDVNEAAQIIAAAVHPDANIIFGATVNDALGDDVQVTVIATGLRRSQ